MNANKNTSADTEKNDILNGSILRISINVGAPLLVASLISIALTSYSNEVYSRYLGKTVFLISGVLASAITLFTNAYGSTSSSTWIRTAKVYAQKDRKKVNTAAVNSLYTVVLMASICMLILLVGKDVIFNIMGVPAEIEKETALYYYVQALIMPLSAVSAMLNAVIMAISGKTVIFIDNLLLNGRAALGAFFFIATFQFGFWGWLLGIVPVTLVHIVIQIWFLRKKGVFVELKKENFVPQWSKIGGNIKYGCLLYAQLILCSISEMVLSMQSNRYLDMDVIATISIVLPISGLVGVIGTLCKVFVPQSYGAGKTERLRKFIYGSIAVGGTYAAACTLFFIFGGEWYFSTLFDDPAMIELGRQYWFWYGLSIVPLAMISIIRTFFDCVGMAKISMLSGIGELVGRIVCAFVLIPCFGNVGRFSAPLVGWGLGGLLMVIMFIKYRKKIFEKCDANRAAA